MSISNGQYNKEEADKLFANIVNTLARMASLGIPSNEFVKEGYYTPAEIATHYNTLYPEEPILGKNVAIVLAARSKKPETARFFSKERIKDKSVRLGTTWTYKAVIVYEAFNECY